MNVCICVNMWMWWRVSVGVGGVCVLGCVLISGCGWGRCVGVCVNMLV